MADPLLRVVGLEAGYGRSRVLFGVTLDVGAGEIVTLMGRNGMGRSTTLKAIMGLIRPLAGAILFDGRDITGERPYRVARAGIGLVPEGRRVFPTLNVKENLLAAARPGPWDSARVFALFPRLGERRHQSGRTLSGGEQQMLAIARALMTAPKLLILDEATEGLAPVIADEIWHCLRRVRAEGVAVLVIDKHVDALTPLADRHYVIEKGRIVWQGDSRALQADRGVVDGLVGL